MSLVLFTCFLFASSSAGPGPSNPKKEAKAKKPNSNKHSGDKQGKQRWKAPKRVPSVASFIPRGSSEPCPLHTFCCVLLGRPRAKQPPKKKPKQRSQTATNTAEKNNENEDGQHPNERQVWLASSHGVPLSLVLFTCFICLRPPRPAPGQPTPKQEANAKKPNSNKHSGEKQGKRKWKAPKRAPSGEKHRKRRWKAPKRAPSVASFIPRGSSEPCPLHLSIFFASSSAGPGPSNPQKRSRSFPRPLLFKWFYGKS